MKPAWEDFKIDLNFWSFFLCNFECLKGSLKAFPEYLSHFSLAMHVSELAVSVNLVQLYRLAGQNLSEHHIYFPLSFCSTALACLCLKQKIFDTTAV